MLKAMVVEKTRTWSLKGGNCTGRRWLIIHGEEEGDHLVLFYTPDLRIGGLFADGYKGSLCGGC